MHAQLNPLRLLKIFGIRGSLGTSRGDSPGGMCDFGFWGLEFGIRNGAFWALFKARLRQD